MAYNPQIHHRRSIRLKGYDYAQAGAYFVTVCCYGKQCFFGQMMNGEMQLNDNGQIAYTEWQKLPGRFGSMELDVFIVMPNHMHAVIVLNDSPVGATLAVAPDDDMIHADLINPDNLIGEDIESELNHEHRAGVNPAPTVGDIVGAYKSRVFNECLKIYKSKNEGMGKLWQRNYYEHIIRNQKSYQIIANYIMDNPVNWMQDKFYVK